MNLLSGKTFFLLIAISICVGCSQEKTDNGDPAKLLIGHWNSYEMGTEPGGFAAVITTSLTIRYESGIAFASDSLFKSRYHNNGKWTETDVAGTYKFKDKTITLTFSPGTKDELKLDLTLVKVDKNHLWFRHSYFGPVIEHHLERTE